MKKEQLFGNRVQEYRDSENPIALYATRISQKKNAEINISEKDIQTIKEFFEKRNFKKNIRLENKMKKTPMSVAPIHISFPPKDTVCFDHLEIRLEDAEKLGISSETKVEITIFDENDLDVVFVEKKIEEIIPIELKKLKTGRYYWTVNIEGNTKTRSFYHCSVLDAIILKDM